MLLLLVPLLLMVTTTTMGQETTPMGPVPRCYIPGECYGITISAGVTQSYNNCLQDCKDNTNCNWITYYERNKECVQLYDCQEVDDNPCGQDCHIGQVECPLREPVCLATGICNGHFVATDVTASARKCLDYCRSVEECNWFSYFPETKTCLLTEDCLMIDDSCTDCVVGERDCHIVAEPGQRLFVAGGRGSSSTIGNTVELIDLSEHPLLCPRPADLPYPLSSAVGTFIDNHPKVCGGNREGTTVRDCWTYKPDANAWTESEPMLVEREGSASVMLSPTQWWVTGGVDANNDAFESTELFTTGQGFSEYVNLPEAMSRHKLVKINSTHVMLIKAKSGLSWMFDLTSESWSSLPDALLATSDYISAGLVTYAGNGSSEVFVVGIFISSTYFYDRVQIFNLETQTWRDGPNVPYGDYYGKSDVPFGSSFLMAGGRIRSGNDYTVAISTYGEEGWVRLPHDMSIARAFSVAILVSNDFMSCT